VAGLGPGDWIVAIDDQPTATVDDLHRRLTGVTPGVSMRVVVLRGGTTLEVLVVPSETP